MFLNFLFLYALVYSMLLSGYYGPEAVRATSDAKVKQQNLCPQGGHLDTKQ